MTDTYSDDGTSNADADSAGMGASGAISMTMGTVTALHRAEGDGTTLTTVHIPVTNGAQPTSDNEIFVDLYTTSDTAESDAERTHWVSAFGAGESRELQLNVQIDPGDWTIQASLYTADGTIIAQADPLQTTVPGHPRHQQEFDDTGQYNLSIEIVEVEGAQNFCRVHYRLHNNGRTPLPEGLPVMGVVVDNEGNASSQDYQLQRGVHAGTAEAHYLTLETTTTPGDGGFLTVTVDPGGQNEQSQTVGITWNGSEKAELAPA